MASSRMLALLGLLAVAGYQNRDKISGFLGRVTGGSTDLGNGRVTSGTDSGGGLLGSLLRAPAVGSGFASGGLAGALGDLVNKFTANGHGDTARSWVETGPNLPVDPTHLETALGDDTLSELMLSTGLSREELLRRLSTVLPTAVDTMTPDGRLPTHDEESRLATRV